MKRALALLMVSQTLRDQKLRATYDQPYPQLPDLWTWVPNSSLKLTQQVFPDWNLPRIALQKGDQLWEPRLRRPERATRRRRTPYVFTLHNSAGMSLTGGKACRFMSDQGCASTSIPREVGWERENQRGHWVDSWDTKRCISAALKVHSPDRSFCLDIKSAARFRTPGIWTALMDKNLSCAQRRSWRACLFRVRKRKPPWRLMWDTTAMLSVLTTSWECARNYQLVLFHVFWVGRCTGTRLLCLNTEKVRFSWYVTFPTFSRKRKKVLW